MECDRGRERKISYEAIKQAKGVSSPNAVTVSLLLVVESVLKVSSPAFIIEGRHTAAGNVDDQNSLCTRSSVARRRSLRCRFSSKIDEEAPLSPPPPPPPPPPPEDDGRLAKLPP